MVTHYRVGSNRLTQRLTMHVSSVSRLPRSYRDAFNDPNWQSAMRDEYNALIKNQTWTLVPRPLDTNNLDVKNAFLHGDLSETVYMHQPPRMFLSQKKYVVEILEWVGMVNCNPSWTPIDTESKMGDTGDVVFDLTLYRSLAGSLKYLTFTRMDISYVVHQVCLYKHDPREPRLYALKRILRYVCGTMDYGLQLFFSYTADLVAYSDADWAGCPTTRCSTFGYCVFLGNNLLSWSSKRQTTLSHSSAEAEYRGIVNAVTETCWLRNLLSVLGVSGVLLVGEVVFGLVFYGEELVIVGDDTWNVGRLCGLIKLGGGVGEGFGDQVVVVDCEVFHRVIYHELVLR
nr:ribonuclease H-like domain-containing protein [Tanacetum cinerariifolium]